jgi:hypothetical protein
LYYWPPGIPNDPRKEAYIAAYETVGFIECADDALEAGFERIAIYAVHGEVQHVARQISNGAWTSKLGDVWDIEHATLDGVESPDYGTPVAFMKRPII